MLFSPLLLSSPPSVCVCRADLKYASVRALVSDKAAGSVSEVRRCRFYPELQIGFSFRIGNTFPAYLSGVWCKDQI